MSVPPLIELDGVGFDAGRVRILRDVALVVDAGSVIGLTGPNGAGKTTLLAIMSTLMRPTTGTAVIAGIDVTSHAVAEIRPMIGWSGHDPGLYPDLTLQENLELTADLAGIDRARVASILEAVGLRRAADRPAALASNGMQRRVDLARLLLTEPSIVLLDEVHAGLDTDATAIVEAVVERTVRAGGCAVVVSHDRSRLNSADRVVEIRDGTLA